MNETFWIAWKASVPVLAIVIVGLLIERRWLRRTADQMEENVRQQCSQVGRLLKANVELQFDNSRLLAELTDAKGLADVLRSREQATCPCSQVKAANERMAYLEERNQKLIFDALSNNAAKYIKVNRN